MFTQTESCHDFEVTPAAVDGNARGTSADFVFFWEQGQKAFMSLTSCKKQKLKSVKMEPKLQQRQVSARSHGKATSSRKADTFQFTRQLSTLLWSIVSS